MHYSAFEIYLSKHFLQMCLSNYMTIIYPFTFTFKHKFFFCYRHFAHESIAWAVQRRTQPAIKTSHGFVPRNNRAHCRDCRHF